ncbi:MAG: hypothetical protein AB1847_19570 [bacterium]
MSMIKDFRCWSQRPGIMNQEAESHPPEDQDAEVKSQGAETILGG